MSLRERSHKAGPAAKAAKKKPRDRAAAKEGAAAQVRSDTEGSADESRAGPAKRLPRVVLRLGPGPVKDAADLGGT